MSDHCKNHIRMVATCGDCHRAMNGEAGSSFAAPLGSDAAAHYPVTVDAKKLWALMRTGDAIIRNPKPDRLAHWRKLRKIIADQCKQHPNEKGQR